jgi:hypothetical protein
MVLSFRSMSAVVCLAVVVGVTAAEARQAPVLAAPTVSGNNVTFNWSATAGATAYRLEYGLASGAYLGGITLGAGSTSFGIGAPNGVFFIRVVAVTPGGELGSNEVVLQVPAAPAAPTGLTVARNGTGFVAVWTPGAGGGTPAGYRLYASLSPGGAPLAVLPSAIAAWGIGSGVPPGTYYLRVSAFNAVGESATSNEVAVVMSVAGDCDAPPTPTLTTSAWGPILSASWTPIAGASSYLFNYAGPGLQGQVPFAGNQTRFSVRGISIGTWQFSVQAVFACGRAGGAGPSTLVVDNSSLRLEPRAADPNGPTPPNYIPLPDRRAVVERLAREYPHEMRNSCGNHAFLFRLLAELRREDKRWGVNWKRNNVGDMSEDVLDYNYGSEADEGTRQVHVVDIIAGHCGPNPGPAWINQTVLFSSGATWTLVPFIEAGYQP